MAKNTKVTLLGDRVLLSPLDSTKEKKTASGFILPGKEGIEKQERGTVIAVGPGRLTTDGKRLPMEVAPGATVIFKRGYDVEELSLDGEEYLLIGEGSILAVLN